MACNKCFLEGKWAPMPTALAVHLCSARAVYMHVLQTIPEACRSFVQPR